MAESSKPSSARPTLEVSIATAVALAANKLITDPDLRLQATTAAPIVGGGLGWLIRQGAQYIRYRRLLSLEKGWLTAAEAERRKPSLSRAKQNELDQEIARRKQAIEQMQRDNLRLQ